MTSQANRTIPLLTLEIRFEHDVVLARQRARQLAELLGLDPQEQTRLATAVSELSRNVFQYAGRGQVIFEVDPGSDSPPAFIVKVRDDGPGIANLREILDGRYESRTGMGLGIVGARRLTERFRIDSEPGRGTAVEVGRSLPKGSPPFTPRRAAEIAEVLARSAAAGPFEEIQQQNQELVRALDELRARQADIERLNAELQETNRGVLALYAELDDRAHELQRASEYKSRFLSDMSHELRTPLTSVLNLSRLLLDRTDGELTSEQETQVRLIRKSVETVTELVNDLLDLAKIEAGKTELRFAEFTVAELFAALRGMCRPLLVGEFVTLVFEDAAGLPPLHTDDRRLGQILRNFLSNAIKFTEQGEIRVTASLSPDGRMTFAVADTGIGIAVEDQERIFQEYTQVDGVVQRRIPGTGLGLPLARKLAGLLGGEVHLVSEFGHGSTFSVIVPREHPDVRGSAADEVSRLEEAGRPSGAPSPSEPKLEPAWSSGAQLSAATGASRAGRMGPGSR